MHERDVSFAQEMRQSVEAKRIDVEGKEVVKRIDVEGKEVNAWK